MTYKRLCSDLVLAACLLATLAGAGCQKKMADRGRITPLEADSFFADGSSARPVVKGTVPREDANDGTVFYTGREGSGYAPRIPVPVDAGMIAAGRDQYGAYCAVCHGARGGGDGIVVRRGFTRPRPFGDPGLLAAPPGYLFAAMTEGFRTMDTCRDLVDERGRWAIAAYIKDTLQARQ
jgi:hypothetical protein